MNPSILSSTQNHRNRNKLSTVTTMNSSSLSTLLIQNNDSAIEFITAVEKRSAPSNVVDVGCCPEATDKINHGSVGALMRNGTIENARSSIASTIPQQRQQEHQTVASTATTSIMRKALLERLEAKLLANAMEFTELERLVDAWKGGVPAALLLLHLNWEPEKVSVLRDENDLFQKFEALLLVKENECHKVRKLVAEARNKHTRLSTPRNPEDTAGSSVPLFIEVIRTPYDFQTELACRIAAPIQ
jgi:hypothetical protein